MNTDDVRCHIPEVSKTQLQFSQSPVPADIGNGCTTFILEKKLCDEGKEQQHYTPITNNCVMRVKNNSTTHP